MVETSSFGEYPYIKGYLYKDTHTFRDICIKVLLSKDKGVCRE